MENRFIFLLLLTSVCRSSSFTVKEMLSASETDGLHFRSELDAQWLDYIKTYNKSYSNEAEMLLRRHVWEENVDMIQKHNDEAAMGVHTYTMGVNQFTDMTSSEFSEAYMGSLDIPDVQSDMAPENDQVTAIPTSIDWRKKGAVTPVKAQGKCESCWAFSANGAIEGQTAIHKEKMVPLSAQNLVDCSQSFGNKGCNKGLPVFAFKYAIKYGVDTEKCYPYEAKDGKCRYKDSCVGARVKDYKKVPKGEDNLRKATATVGPISVGVTQTANFQHYKSGTFSDPGCNKKDPDHAVLVVGYSPGYWIIKNSWGTTWGISGYMHLAMDKGDMCHVSQIASYPIL